MYEQTSVNTFSEALHLFYVFFICGRSPPLCVLIIASRCQLTLILVVYVAITANPLGDDNEHTGVKHPQKKNTNVSLYRMYRWKVARNATNGMARQRGRPQLSVEVQYW